MFDVVDSRPATFTERPSSSNAEVAVRVHVRNCGAVTRDTVIPLAVVTDHWFGHYSNRLFSNGGYPGITQVAWQACHGR